MKPVPADRIQAWRSGEPGPCPELRPVATPGHIAHHVAYLDERDGMLFAGDAMGIVLSDGPSHPPTPPPAVDLRAWRRTLDEIGQIGPERFGATHFGIHGDVDTRREQLQSRLDALEARVRTALHAGDEEDARRYNDEIREEFAPFMGEDRVGAYFEMFSAAVDWAGVAFYLKRNP